MRTTARRIAARGSLLHACSGTMKTARDAAIMPLRILLGLSALFLGRRLFWLFVGVVGFAIGVDVSTQLFAGAPYVTVLVIALIAGVVGALLAYFLQEVVIAIAGFLAGGQVAASLVAALFHHGAHIFGIPFLIGGVLGALLFVIVFDWALIWISSLLGAGFIVEALNVSPIAAVAAYIFLVALGVVVQASWLGRRRLPRAHLEEGG
jgi:hypothetical protein